MTLRLRSFGLMVTSHGEPRRSTPPGIAKRVLRRRASALTSLVVASCTLGAFVAFGISPSARAQPGPPQAPTTQCSLRGEPLLPSSAVIVDARGQPIAHFSSVPTPLVASDFPSDAQGKVRVETGFGAGSFRLRGFMAPNQLPLFTAANVVVAPGHVWIAANRSVTLVGAAAGRLRVEKPLSTPFQQTFRGAAACSAFNLEAGIPAGFTPPGGARSYALERESLDVYADAGAETPITTLHRSPATSAVLFLSNAQKAGFVHIEYHGDVIVEGWAKASALTALPLGETMDQLAPAITQRGSPQIAFQTQPKLVRPSKDVPLRIAAKEADPTIGVIEPGTETYVLDQVAGWASVLPKSMHVLPPGDAHFWAKSSDLGL